jgi:glycosyltransferase involved in cell wall biosynthesis
MASGVPVIVSRRCGDVTNDGVDGVLLDDLDPQTLALTLATLAADPGRVGTLRVHARLSTRFGLDPLGEALEAIPRDQGGCGRRLCPAPGANAGSERGDAA